MFDGLTWTLGSSTFTWMPNAADGTGWFVLAVVTAGLAATRNRSRLNWFFGTMLFGPLATVLLVVWPPLERYPAVERPPRRRPKPAPTDAEADAGSL